MIGVQRQHSQIKSTSQKPSSQIFISLWLLVHDLVWATLKSTCSFQNKVEISQNKSVRIHTNIDTHSLFGCPCITYYIYNQLQLCGLEIRDPEYLKTTFVVLVEIHAHQTRASVAKVQFSSAKDRIIPQDTFVTKHPNLKLCIIWNDFID